MSNQCPPEPRCVDFGVGDVPIETNGFCQAYFTLRGFRAMAEMLQPRAPSEPHREAATRHRLAAIIAVAAGRMLQGERTLLWLERYRLMGTHLDDETQPELCAMINALRDPLPEEARASTWN